MTALQRAFSRHEKIRRLLANLEELKKNGEVDPEQYSRLKAQYEALLDAALENLKTIRKQIKEQRQQAQETLSKLQADANAISTRVKVGEITPEKVAGELAVLQSKKDACAKTRQQYDAWLAARSTTDLGGYVDVDVNQAIEYPPQSVTNQTKAGGNIGDRARDLLGGKVPAGSNFKKYLPTIISVCVGVLLVVFLGHQMLAKRPSTPTLSNANKTITPAALVQAPTGDAQAAAGAAAQAAGCAACGGGLLFIFILFTALIVLNIVLLVWVARDAKARGMDSAVVWMLLVFFTGLLGLIIYLFSRPKGNVVMCPSCNNKRLQASAKCPHCGNP